MKPIVSALIFVAAAFGITACGTNPEVPAGHEGYVFESPRIFGEGGFRRSIRGPGNYGFSMWRNLTINVDTRPNTYAETFKILAKDKVNMAVGAQVILSLKPNSVQDVVENHGSNKWYERKVKKVFRSFVRREVQQYRSGVIKEKRDEIEEAIRLSLADYLEKTPFVIIKLVVGNIDFPEKIVQEIENRVAMEEKEKAKDIENLIAAKDAEIRRTEAKGIRDAQQIIDQSLTTNYLQYEAIKSQAKMASSPNHTVVYIPSGENGIPLVKTTDQRGKAR